MRMGAKAVTTWTKKRDTGSEGRKKQMEELKVREEWECHTSGMSGWEAWQMMERFLCPLFFSLGFRTPPLWLTGHYTDVTLNLTQSHNSVFYVLLWHMWYGHTVWWQLPTLVPRRCERMMVQHHTQFTSQLSNNKNKIVALIDPFIRKYMWIHSQFKLP